MEPKVVQNVKGIHLNINFDKGEAKLDIDEVTTEIPVSYPKMLIETLFSGLAQFKGFFMEYVDKLCNMFNFNQACQEEADQHYNEN